MKKLSILFTAAMLVMSMSFASCSKTSGSKMKTTIDSLSYAYGVGLGIQMAKQHEQFPAKLNIDLFLAVFEKALKGDTAKLAISPEKAIEVFQRCLATAQADASKAAKEETSKFLAKNAKADGVKTTPSGLQYSVIKEVSGAKPIATDTVTVNYKGSLLDGKVFESSYDTGAPAVFPLDRVIKGWTEGIQLMSVGSKYKFWIPAELAYGETGGPKPGALLIFEVELLNIKSAGAQAKVAVIAPTAKK